MVREYFRASGPRGRRTHAQESPASPSTYHDSLSAVTGLIFIARMAGMNDAAIATSASTPATSAKVSASVGATLNSIDAMKRVSAIAAASPMAVASSVSS